MADRSISRVSSRRAPLRDATNQGNSATGPTDLTSLAPEASAVSCKAAYHHPNATAVATNNRISAISKESNEKSEAKRHSQVSAASTDASSSRPRKSHVGPWQLGKTLGKGSSGRVRTARHSVTKQLAAVKIVPKKLSYLCQVGSLAALDRYDSSFPDVINGEKRLPLAIEREIAILKLIEHPNIMKLYDIWENRSEMSVFQRYPSLQLWMLTVV